MSGTCSPASRKAQEVCGDVSSFQNGSCKGIVVEHFRGNSAPPPEHLCTPLHLPKSQHASAPQTSTNTGSFGAIPLL